MSDQADTVQALGESAYFIQTNRARALAADLAARPFVGFEEAVPALGSLTVLFNPLAAKNVASELRSRLAGLGVDETALPGRTHILPVTLGGPDLGWVLERTELDLEELTAQLCSLELEVAFLGFTPGFAFLTGLPEHLQMPRLETPRERVPPGSLGLGGPWAGVYPLATPGGWRLIGHTEARLFDAARPEPFLLRAGDTVRFEVQL
ncbi:5-oxoprolinase subunit B family protein [Deinococcus sp.]|uniref:5-oxoprolinase subunit B family protein n=1 Tax=Deinococcus sp. TaxID=47478 RepID=UPI003B5A1450